MNDYLLYKENEYKLPHHYIYSMHPIIEMDGTGILPVTVIDLGITDFYIFMGGQGG